MEEWKSLRLSCIGASEVASLFDCGYDNVVDLWSYKTANKTKKQINQEISEIGHSYEKIIIDYAKEKFNLDFIHNKENKHFRSKDYNYIGCTPDAYNDKAILQCKTFRVMKNRKKWSDTTIPFNYILQTIQEMFVMEKKIGYLAVQYFIYKGKDGWVADNIDVFEIDIEDWQDILDEIIKRSALFWDCVSKNEVPDTNFFKQWEE